jgi:hypothetical protein
MLVFVIPLQSKAVAKSWERVSQLLEKCVQSACRQTHSDFHVIVVCHDKPDITFNHPQLSYVEVDFPIPDITLGTAKEILDRKHTDKGRKQLAGLVAAQNFNPSHTMLLDADDLVSNRLAGLVHENPQSYGWVLKDGYLYAPGSSWIYKKSGNFYKMCGSCNIIRNDLNNTPENPEYNRGYGYYKFYIDHGKVPEVLAGKGYPLEVLPFYGAVYVVQTGENIYFDSYRLRKGFSRYFKYRWVGRRLKEEFNL